LNSIFIDKREIGEDCSPFIIAEMSGNHNQSLERALEIVEAAANLYCGYNYFGYYRW
jgi:sialic acid synthase SpsE